LKATETLIPELANAGVDFFEIGFPFSDPIADGPVIQKSSESSLKKGTTWKQTLHMIRRVRTKSQVPLVLMTYANALFCRGWKKSLRELRSAGADGAIIPDLIPEESRDLHKLFDQEGLKLIHLAAPTSPPERIKKIGRESSGFVYCVSVTGVTGSRKNLPEEEIKAFLKQVREHSKVPAVLGFGISEPKQCETFKNFVDGFVIGSKMIQLISQPALLPVLTKRAVDFVKKFKGGMK
jgi:tryptophan synthase alpha chain